MSAANSNASNANANTTVLITGASRGIGLGLVEVYAKKGFRVVAAARDPAKADGLKALVQAHPKNIAAVTLDVADSKSVAALPAQLAALQPPVIALDVLINNAAVFGGPGLKPLAQHTVQTFADVYRTNVIGIWELTETLLPLIRKSAAPKLANISSIMGSVTITSTFQFPGLAAAYRLSKAALNELSMVQSREYNAATVAATPSAAKPEAHAHSATEAVSALAREIAGGAAADAKKKEAVAPVITVLALEPGWVDTDLGTAGGTIPHKPALTVPQSAEGIERVVSAAPVSAIASFVDYSGKAMPW